jgi:hypothetical protein
MEESLIRTAAGKWQVKKEALAAISAMSVGS